MPPVRSANPGGIIWVNDATDGAKGREQQGNRPWVVISERIFTDNPSTRGLVQAVVVTTGTGGVGSRNDPFLVELDASAGTVGRAVIHQVRLLDLHARVARRSGQVSAETLEEIRRGVWMITGLPSGVLQGP